MSKLEKNLPPPLIEAKEIFFLILFETCCVLRERVWGKYLIQVFYFNKGIIRGTLINFLRISKGIFVF